MNNLIRSIKPKLLNRRQDRFRNEHETCVLCGSRLVLKFEKVESSDKKIREVAECPACLVRARSTDHEIQ